MKLLTHNMLMSPGTRNGYPLGIEVEKMEEVEAEFNSEFTARMVEKLDYAALLKTLANVSCCLSGQLQSDCCHLRMPEGLSPSSMRAQLSVETTLPEAVPEEYAENEAFLTALHHAIMEIEILEGNLVCPETDKRFPIKDGIPSML